MTIADLNLDALEQSELETLAGLPSTAPWILEPKHLERVLGWNRTDRLKAERLGILEPIPRSAYQTAQYRTVDVCRAIIAEGLKPRWELLDPED